MKIFLDEVDKDFRNFFIVGALFVPTASGIVGKIHEVRNTAKFNEELKFTNISNWRQRVYKAVLDEFIACPYCYARVIVVPCHLIDMKGYFGGQEHLCYNKFTQLLLKHNMEGINNALLYADAMGRKNEDNFFDYLHSDLNLKRTEKGLPPFLKKVPEPLDSKLSQEIQLVDLIVGAVNNEVRDPGNEKKGDVRKHLLSGLRISSFQEARGLQKLRVWFWRPSTK